MDTPSWTSILFLHHLVSIFLNHFSRYLILCQPGAVFLGGEEVFTCNFGGSAGLYATTAVRGHNISDKIDSTVICLWPLQVLYHMFESYTEMGPNNILYTDVLAGFASFFVVALGGTIIGILWGFLTGLVTRYTHQVRVIEPIFIFVMAYLAYLNAEIFHMSGILA